MEKQWIVLAGEEAGPKSNKLGGIWEVIDAEAATIASLKSKGELNDNIKTIVTGPYYRCDGCDWNTEQNRITDVKDLKKLTPDKDLKKAIDAIDKTWTDVVSGVKKVDGEDVSYVLFDTDKYLISQGTYVDQELLFADEVKMEAFNLVGLDSLSFERSGYGREYTHYLNLSHAISQFVRLLALSGSVSLHCHEFGVFYAGARLKKLRTPNVKTVATFHATKVGRSWGSEVIDKISSNDGSWHPYTAEGLAQMEALAKYFDSATCVGDTTRLEARLFYGIDSIVVPNGILVDTDTVDWKKKKICREKIQNFLSENMYEFYDGEKREAEHILPIFTISRIELENKGYPDLLDALVLFDRALKNRIRNGEVDEDTIVVCLMIASHGPKQKDRLPKGFPVYLPEELLVGNERRLKKMILSHELDFKKIITGRRVVSALEYPQWVGKDDGGLGMTVDEIAAGCIAGIFPSRYDPFLLTGLEAGREGTPVIVSRICGFSDAVREYVKKRGVMGGVIVVDNIKLPYLETLADYAMGLDSITTAYLRDKSKYRMMCKEAFNLSKDMNWEEPVKKYYDILSMG
ncbi:MAG: glycosyltransferase family 4 protein [Candidatus Hydrothermarchaeales archaeon]